MLIEINMLSLIEKIKYFKFFYLTKKNTICLSYSIKKFKKYIVKKPTIWNWQGSSINLKSQKEKTLILEKNHLELIYIISL